MKLGSYARSYNIKFVPIYTANKDGLENITYSNEKIEDNYQVIDYELTLKADDGFMLPDDVTVYMDGEEFIYYNYDSETGKFSIQWGYISGNFELIAEAVEVSCIEFQYTDEHINIIEMNSTDVKQQNQINVVPGTECELIIEAVDDRHIIEKIQYGETTVEPKTQNYTLNFNANENMTIKIITREIASYDLIIESDDGAATEFSSQVVYGGEELYIMIYEEYGFGIDTVTKIIEYKSGKDNEVTVITDQVEDDELKLDIEDNNDIKSIKIVIETISLTINTIEEFLAALGGNDFAEVNGNVITLLKDVELKRKVLCMSGEYILDLNGHEITYGDKFNDSDLFIIDGTSKLTINDSSNGDGVIKSEWYYGVYVTREGELIINGGNINSMDTVIYVDCSGKLTVNGGKITSIEYTTIYFTDDSTVTINDGELIGGFAALEIDAGYYENQMDSIVIKGGKFKGAGYGPIIIYGISENNNPVKVSDILPEGCIFEASDEIQEKTEIEDDYFYVSYLNNKEVTVKDTTNAGDQTDDSDKDQNDDQKEDQKEDLNDDKKDEEKEETKNEGNNVQTGDNIMLYVAILAISLVGIGGTFIIRKRSKNNK